MSNRVLLIEDDAELGAQITSRLARAGFAPTWWKEGRHIDPASPPDVALVILDLMLPGVWGLEVLTELRACSEVPVLVLSARVDTSDKVRALKLGADDYMTKPFWPEELIERVRARLRRPALERSDVIDVGPLHLDLLRREVTVGGKPVELTRVELELLAALARRPGMPITRAWLTEHVLDRGSDDGERTLDVHVSRLRKKLGKSSLVETVWGIGYRLAPGRDE